MLNLDDLKPRTMEFSVGGEQYAIPAIDAMDADSMMDFLEDASRDGSFDQVGYLSLFRAVLDEHAPGALGRMRVDQMNALLKEWQKSGNAGESSPSSD